MRKGTGKMSVCGRHKINPAKIYLACIGCEIEYLTRKANQLDLVIEHIEKNYSHDGKGVIFDRHPAVEIIYKLLKGGEE
jgi:hypothetical protein